MKKTGAEIVVKTLIDLGIDTIFGYPGSAVLDIYNYLDKYKKNIFHVLAAHEQGACHAADGYARASGKVGVVIATSGPGATNLVTGIAAAHLDSSPLLIITGNTSLSQIGTDSFQEVDTMDITMPITKHNYIVKDVKNLKRTITEAYYIAKSNRPGPVLVDIPCDIQKELCNYSSEIDSEQNIVFRPTQEEISSALNLINQSCRPLIYIGGGCINSGCSKKIKQLAESLSAPIGSSLMGISCIPNDFPYYLGITGMYERNLTSEIKKNSDLIIALGVRFSDRAACNKNNYADDVKILHVDIDPCEINKNITPTLGIRSDIGEFLSAIIPHINISEKEKNSRKNQLDLYYSKKPAKLLSDKLTPQFIINSLQNLTEKDTVIATDVGKHQLWTAKYYHFSVPRTFITSGGLGAMGFGMGAAIGACFANNKKKTVLITGDGSFSMNCNELCTAVTFKLPLIVIIMNNNSLGMVRQWQKSLYNQRFSYTTLDRKTDFSALAKAYGAGGEEVKTKEELNKALQNAFNSDMPYIIDCKIDIDEDVLPMKFNK